MQLSQDEMDGQIGELVTKTHEHVLEVTDGAGAALEERPEVRGAVARPDDLVLQSTTQHQPGLGLGRLG